jgi:hypothetical protein
MMFDEPVRRKRPGRSPLGRLGSGGGTVKIGGKEVGDPVEELQN